MAKKRPRRRSKADLPEPPPTLYAELNEHGGIACCDAIPESLLPGTYGDDGEVRVGVYTLSHTAIVRRENKVTITPEE